jgi:mannose/cellobiose epimerase-like protein (N-acyl-D-glucosamine 2-epimerase family)
VDLKPRVRAIRQFMLSHIWDGQRGLVHDHFHESFENPSVGPGGKTSLAHGLEWMAFFRLFEGCALPEAVERRVLSMALGCGLRKDGFFQDTFFFPEERTAGPAQFWTQTEAVVGFNVARRVYGEEYHEPLMALADYYMNHFVDAEHGGIFSEIDCNGVVVDRKKGGYWKADYHSVRMCAEIMYGDGDRSDG